MTTATATRPLSVPVLIPEAALTGLTLPGADIAAYPVTKDRRAVTQAPQPSRFMGPCLLIPLPPPATRSPEAPANHRGFTMFRTWRTSPRGTAEADGFATTVNAPRPAVEVSTGAPE